MELDKEPTNWGLVFVFSVWLGFNLVSCCVTWAHDGFFAALGWLSAIVMIIALIVYDIIIGGQRRIIKELDASCRRVIKERDEYVKQHKEAAKINGPAATDQGTR